MSEVGYITVPFKAESGITQIDGMGKFSPAGVVLEFESKLFGLIKSGVKEDRISIGEILDIRFRKGVFKRGSKIEIRLKSFTRLADFPNSDGKITLKIGKDDFERAEEAVNVINRSINETAAGLPPTHTPVSRLFEEAEDTRELGDK